jgi:two-component system NtrC family response regulator
MVEALGGTGCRVFIATNLAEAILQMEKHRPDVVLFGSLVERGVLEEVGRRNVPCPIAIFLKDLRDSASLLATIRRAVGVEPPKQDDEEMSVGETGSIIRGRHGKRPIDRASEILGGSACMAEVRSRVADAARSELNVLITGETGTGKELVARAVHRLSPRGDKPFVIVNCANTPGDLWESLFFGHSRGAFTGANDDRDGLLEEANGSYLFLDELQAMSAEQQPKFLRVIEDGEVRPLGSLIVRKVSVRFIIATNLDPEQLVIAGKLRQDLFYRLRGFEIRLPPLRDHPEDISVLAAHFLDGSGVGLSKEALEALQAQAWPGNVRELRNVLLAARAVAASKKQTITPHHLTLIQGRVPPGTAGLEGRRFFVSGTLKEIEEQVITRTLLETKGNRSEAAHRLGIERKTLWARLKQFERNRQRNA